MPSHSDPLQNPTRCAVVLLAHGSSDPCWSVPLEAIHRQLRQQLQLHAAAIEKEGRAAEGKKEEGLAEMAVHARAVLPLPAAQAEVRLCYWEKMSPGLAQTVAELSAAGFTRVLLLPCFIAMGTHLRRALPAQLAALRAAHPQLQIEWEAALGEQAALQAAIVHWAVQCYRVFAAGGMPAA